MTRAADRLVVAGSRGEMKMPEGCWYQLAETALKPDAIEEPADDGDGNVWRWRKFVPDTVPDAPEAAAPSVARHDVPGWLTRNAPQAPALARTIAPSAAPGGAAIHADLGALARGQIIHRLLQARNIMHLQIPLLRQPLQQGRFHRRHDGHRGRISLPHFAVIR